MICIFLCAGEQSKIPSFERPLAVCKDVASIRFVPKVLVLACLIQEQSSLLGLYLLS